MSRLLPLFLLLVLLPNPVTAAEPVDWKMVNRIRSEGFHRSEVMETLRHLTDVIGPRLTGSPQMTQANEWTRDRFASWGLAQARLQPWGPFGRGWSYSRISAHLLEPRRTPLLALPAAWSPGTGGSVRGAVAKAVIEEEEDLEEHRGKLGGKVVFLSEPREIEPPDREVFERYDDEELADLFRFEIPEERDEEERRRERLERRRLARTVNEFLSAEGALAAVEISSRDHGVLRVTLGGSRHPDEDPGVPRVVLGAEQYNWVLRLLEKGEQVELELDVEASFHDQDPMAYNTLAEIPGSEPGAGWVMAGAHLDSWHAGAGSNDNAAGCAVVMEAARILAALEVRPRRTILFALWSGEEQGFLGSTAFVSEHLAARPEPEDPEQRKLPDSLRETRWPLEIKPGHARFSAYFNVDNGSGRIRGIYTQENAAVVPIFEAWLEPFHDLGADTVTNRNTGGTDHLPFDGVGLPGFQFIQDRLDYFTRTHHSNLDVFDHARREDLMQASVVLASFLYHAATRAEPLPRKPMPQAPPETQEPESLTPP